jgi:hypothetical protein
LDSPATTKHSTCNFHPFFIWYDLRCKSDSNNNKHFRDVNLTMPCVHINCFTCCIVIISNNGMQSTNASMTPVDSCTTPSMSGRWQTGDLEREGVKGRQVDPHHMLCGHAHAGLQTAAEVGGWGRSVEDFWRKHEHESLTRGHEVIGIEQCGNSGHHRRGEGRQQRPQCPRELLQCSILRCLALSRGCIFCTFSFLERQIVLPILLICWRGFWQCMMAAREANWVCTSTCLFCWTQSKSLQFPILVFWVLFILRLTLISSSHFTCGYCASTIQMFLTVLHIDCIWHCGYSISHILSYSIHLHHRPHVPTPIHLWQCIYAHTLLELV